MMNIKFAQVVRPGDRSVAIMQKDTTLQAAEKLVRAVCPGFIPDITTMESMWALAPGVHFSGIPFKRGFFVQPV
jgi:hypothetical protein